MIRMNTNRLKELRKNAGLSQQELAGRLGLAASTMGMYEQGRRTPDYDTLIRLALIFHVTTDYLLGLEHPEAEWRKSEEELLEQLVKRDMSAASSRLASEEERRALMEELRAAVDSVLEKSCAAGLQEKNEA